MSLRSLVYSYWVLYALNLNLVWCINLCNVFLRCFHFGKSLDEVEVIIFNILSRVGIVFVHNQQFTYRFLYDRNEFIAQRHISGSCFCMARSKFLDIFNWRYSWNSGFPNSCSLHNPFVHFFQVSARVFFLSFFEKVFHFQYDLGHSLSNIAVPCSAFLYASVHNFCGLSRILVCAPRYLASIIYYSTSTSHLHLSWEQIFSNGNILPQSYL